MKKIKTLKDELENAGWKIEEDIETPAGFEGFFLTLIRSSEVGLAMNIYSVSMILGKIRTNLPKKSLIRIDLLS